jgi:hypothetical protein
LWYRGLNQGFMFARKMLYYLSHNSSSDISSCIYWPLYYFFWDLFNKVAHLLSGLFVLLVFNFMRSLPILNINSLFIEKLAKIFSHSVGCLFNLFHLMHRIFIAWYDSTRQFLLLFAEFLESYLESP